MDLVLKSMARGAGEYLDKVVNSSMKNPAERAGVALRILVKCAPFDRSRSRSRDSRLQSCLES